jgi:DnaK suppressor protein
MNTTQLDQYRKQLESQMESLQKNSESHQQQIEGTHDTPDFVGPDRAAELESLEVDSWVVDSEVQLLEKIQHALDRIDDGSYGICEACNEEIPSARLEAKPSVSLCLVCQERHEQEQQ